MLNTYELREKLPYVCYILSVSRPFQDLFLEVFSDCFSYKICMCYSLTTLT